MFRYLEHCFLNHGKFVVQFISSFYIAIIQQFSASLVGLVKNCVHKLQRSHKIVISFKLVMVHYMNIYLCNEQTEQSWAYSVPQADSVAIVAFLCQSEQDYVLDLLEAPTRCSY